MSRIPRTHSSTSTIRTRYSARSGSTGLNHISRIVSLEAGQLWGHLESLGLLDIGAISISSTNFQRHSRLGKSPSLGLWPFSLGFWSILLCGMRQHRPVAMISAAGHNTSFWPSILDFGSVDFDKTTHTAPANTTISFWTGNNLKNTWISDLDLSPGLDRNSVSSRKQTVPRWMFISLLPFTVPGSRICHN